MYVLRYVWASPATLLGLCVALAGRLSGGTVCIEQGVIEAHGGLVTALLRGRISAAAMTLGHVILGRNQECLDFSRRHEHVHVRQYERWGPLMIPIYLTASAVLYFRGFDPYLDNPFEKEAFGTR